MPADQPSLSDVPNGRPGNVNDLTDDLPGVSRPHLPSSLADADPFAGPDIPTRPSPPAQERSHGRDHGTTAAPLAAGAPTSFVPCPCGCACGNDTNKTYAEVDSLSATRFLRCVPCGEALHFGDKFNNRTDPATNPQMGAADVVGVGRRAGGSVVVRKPHQVDADAEWDRQIRQQLETERRTAAIERWQAALPERWQMPYTEGEELLPEVEERLQRIADTNGSRSQSGAASSNTGDHATSLLCVGPFGSGKTWVAYTYARAAVDRWLLWPQEVRVGTEAEIMEPIASAAPWEVAKVTQQLLHPNLKMLIIDDVGTLGTYKNIETRHAAFTKIINWMYEHKRALVLTTNLLLGEDESLDKWIGPTAYERLRHMVGRQQVFREENKRAELTAKWEAEYQSMKASGDRD